MFNASLGAWNPAAAVSYAKANCGSGPGLCAEFASRAIAAGGAGNPVITWVPTLQSVRALFSFCNCFCAACHAAFCRCAALQSAARVLTSLGSGLSTTAGKTSGQLAAVLPAPSSSTTPRPRAWTTLPSPWAAVSYPSTTPTAAGSSQPRPHLSHLRAFVVFVALSVASICHASSSHAFALQHQRRVGHPPCLLQRLLMHRAMLRRCHFVTFSEMLPLLNRWWCCD